MKKYFIIAVCCLCIGCAYGNQGVDSVLDHPAQLLKDPHYQGYQNQADALESQYLQGDMTYAEYVEQKQLLEDKYTREVDKRLSIIEGFE